MNLLEDGLDGRLQAAFSEYERDNLQYGLAWLTNIALHALDEHEEAVVYTARFSDDNFVTLPMKLNTHSNQGHALSTFYTSAFSPILCTTVAKELLSALFQYLRNVEKLTTITLAPLDTSCPEYSLLQHTMLDAGWSGIHTYFCFGNWVHDLDNGSYTSYLASRPSQLKNTIARRTRKFCASERGHLQIVTGGDYLETAIDQYVAVYNRSWKKEEPYPNFVPELMRLAAQKGWLRLGIASYDDRAVASQIWLVCEGTAYIYKLAYDEEYQKLSAGTILTAHMMEYVIDEDKISRIDYLSGDDPYKKDWMSLRRERHGIAGYNARTLVGSLLFLGHRLRTLLKKFRK